MTKAKRLLITPLVVIMVISIFLTGCAPSKEEVKEEYDFSVFLGSLDDPIEIDALINEYEEQNVESINTIIQPESKDSQESLKGLLTGEDKPAVYAVHKDVDTQWLLDEGYINEDDKPVQYLLSGYGYVFDRSMFEQIFGKSKAIELIKDLRACTYEEWIVFIDCFDDYIKGRNSHSFSIQNNSYEFPEDKNEKTENLNGVFAFPGANSDVYGYSLMDVVAQSADLNEWETAANESTESAINVMNPTLTTYVDGLDFITSNLAGKYSSGIRGSDFGRDDYYSNYLVLDMFMSGKGAFALMGNSKYGEVESLNAEKAQYLEFLPVKMPYDSHIQKTSSGAIFNSSIPAESTYSLYVNRSLPEDVQKKAEKFLSWFSEKENIWNDPLSLSIKTYVDEGNVLQYDYEPTELRKWEKIIFAKDGIASYLKKELWTEETKSEMKMYMCEQWNER